MKLLIFAHTPPPHHGQSFMVKLLLDAFGGDHRSRHGTRVGVHPLAQPESGSALSCSSSADEIECYHVNSRFSEGITDIGGVRLGKLWRLFRYCLEALWCRWRYGVTNFFYVPAPPLRAPLYRDWLIFLWCRPFFRRRIYYWQAAGLAAWLRTARPWERWVSFGLLGKPDLSIVLGEFCRDDATAFASRRTAVVPNGIPDPCPDFEERLEPRRIERVHQRSGLLESKTPVTPPNGSEASYFRVLFIGLCAREKGLFDLLDAVVQANQALGSSHTPVCVQLLVAGSFFRQTEETEFQTRIQDRAFAFPAHLEARIPPVARQRLAIYRGFVSGDAKAQLFQESDCLAFPTYYPAESFGIVAVEAMAYGLPVLATRWRTLPEILAGTPAILVDPQQPAQVAAGLLELIRAKYRPEYRERFLAAFTAERHVAQVREAVLQVEGAVKPDVAEPATAH